MVVGGFRRTVSFPNPIQGIGRPSKPPPTTKSYHVRSASLPCSSSTQPHPLIQQLQSEINNLRDWESRRGLSTWSWLEEGLDRLKTLHNTLDDILQLPLTHDCLATTTTNDDDTFVSKLLEDYLQFVDVYGIFRSTMLALKQDLSSAQVAVRSRAPPPAGRVDDSSSNNNNNKLSLRKAAKEMSRLVSAIRSVDNDLQLGCHVISDSNYDALSVVISEVHDLTVTVSASLFDGVLMLLSSGRRSASWAAGFGGFLTMKKSASSLKRDTITTTEEISGITGQDLILQFPSVDRLTRMKSSNKMSYLDQDADGEMMIRIGKLKSMQEMEDRIGLMESGSEKVFRSLITTRVSLLNILTHSS